MKGNSTNTRIQEIFEIYQSKIDIEETFLEKSILQKDLKINPKEGSDNKLSKLKSELDLLQIKLEASLTEIKQIEKDTTQKIQKFC